MIAVFLFLALFAAVVLWSAVDSEPPAPQPTQAATKADTKSVDGNAKDETGAP
jgi:hypothetical protein